MAFPAEDLHLEEITEYNSTIFMFSLESASFPLIYKLRNTQVLVQSNEFFTNLLAFSLQRNYITKHRHSLI